MLDIKTLISDLKKDFEGLESKYFLDDKKRSLIQLEAKTTDPALWQDQNNAKKVMQEFSDLKNEIADFEDIKESIEVLDALSDDVSLSTQKEYELINSKLREFLVKSFLNDPYDTKNALLTIHAGQGGTEAMDWSSMLYRMYLRFCEKRKWSTETIQMSPGEEAGYKSITFKVEGNYAFGYLKNESGTHRLVRQSPFNADKLRQTSFALVEVLPEVEEVDLPDLKIKDEDLEWQFYRASSQGGQNVQKVSTAVRLRHIPTDIVVTAQTQRFQVQNRKIALDLLMAKLWILEKRKREENIKDIKGEYRPASWGNQIRSYVLHPYKMVKDLRTGFEVGNAESVLDGDLDGFIEAELKLEKK